MAPQSETSYLGRLVRCCPEPAIFVGRLLVLTLVLGANLVAQSQPERLALDINHLKFEGNEAITDEELIALVEGEFPEWDDQPMEARDLERIRALLTRAIRDRGYLNSGVILPNQEVVDGTVVFRVVEGRLGSITVSGERHLKPSYVKALFKRVGGRVLLKRNLTDAYEFARSNPSLASIRAELKPAIDEQGARVPGESVLNLDITEVERFSLEAQLRNDRPPSVGAEILELVGDYRNLWGWNDRFDFRYGVVARAGDSARLSGLDIWGVGYQIDLPILANFTTVGLRYQRSDFGIFEAPFDAFDFETKTQQFEFSVTQPLIRTRTIEGVLHELSVSLSAGRTSTETSVFGVPISISEGAIEGEMAVRTVRLGTEWVRRGKKEVVAIRLRGNGGVDGPGTKVNNSRSEGRFFSATGQAQLLKRVPLSKQSEPYEATLMARASGQWADRSLVAVEQLTLGGMRSVRGYRENELIRDQGINLTVELQFPLWEERDREGAVFSINPFHDYGRGWDYSGEDTQARDLASVGLGLLYRDSKRIAARIDFGVPLIDRRRSTREDLQDFGIHFSLRYRLF